MADQAPPTGRLTGGNGQELGTGQPRRFTKSGCIGDGWQWIRRDDPESSRAPPNGVGAFEPTVSALDKIMARFDQLEFKLDARDRRVDRLEATRLPVPSQPYFSDDGDVDGYRSHGDAWPTDEDGPPAYRGGDVRRRRGKGRDLNRREAGLAQPGSGTIPYRAHTASRPRTSWDRPAARVTTEFNRGFRGDRQPPSWDPSFNRPSCWDPPGNRLIPSFHPYDLPRLWKPSCWEPPPHRASHGYSDYVPQRSPSNHLNRTVKQPLLPFKKIYNLLRDLFPMVDGRALRAVAINHINDVDAAVEEVRGEIIPFFTERSAPTSPLTWSAIAGESSYGSSSVRTEFPDQADNEHSFFVSGKKESSGCTNVGLSEFVGAASAGHLDVETHDDIHSQAESLVMVGETREGTCCIEVLEDSQTESTITSEDETSSSSNAQPKMDYIQQNKDRFDGIALEVEASNMDDEDGIHDSSKIATFDFDGCLDKTSVKGVNADTWSLVFPSIPEKLNNRYTNELQVAREESKPFHATIMRVFVEEVYIDYAIVGHWSLKQCPCTFTFDPGGDKCPKLLLSTLRCFVVSTLRTRWILTVGELIRAFI